MRVMRVSIIYIIQYFIDEAVVYIHYGIVALISFIMSFHIFIE